MILGILASFVVPNLLGNKEKADQQKVVTDIVALENALTCTSLITVFTPLLSKDWKH